MSTTIDVLSPTTGEPVDVVARRNRLGVLLLIACDLAGTLALLIAYSYLWSLNVNDAWAPNTIQYGGNGNVVGRTSLPFADDWPFWAIFLGVIVTCLLMWTGYRGIRDGHRGRLLVAGTLAGLVGLMTLVGQIVQMKSFPFQPSNGSYASAVYLLTAASVVHLTVGGFLILGVVNRVRSGRITVADPSQARLVSIWVTWLVVACFFSTLFTTVMKASPNANPPEFGSVTRSAPTPSMAPASPAASTAASPAASPSGS